MKQRGPVGKKTKKGARKKEPVREALPLTTEEKEVVVKACRQFRQYIPAYLESRKPETVVIDAIINKLSRR